MTLLIKYLTYNSVVTIHKFVPETIQLLPSLHICRKGYECIKILIAILLIRLKGLKIYKAGVALNLKRVFPLFNTTKVCGERKREIIKALELITTQNNIFKARNNSNVLIIFTSQFGF